MSVNGMICWSKSMTASQGTQECGQGGFGPSNEDAIPVTECSITLYGSGTVPLYVRVWTNLDSKDAKQESFGITNVVIHNEPAGNYCCFHRACGLLNRHSILDLDKSKSSMPCRLLCVRYCC